MRGFLVVLTVAAALLGAASAGAAADRLATPSAARSIDGHRTGAA